MAGESQKEPVTGPPDPTTRTTEQMLRMKEDSEETTNAKFAEVKTRLDAVDRATELLHQDLTRFPTEVQKEAAHLKEIFDIRLNAQREITDIHQQYRLELKADSEKALTAALAAAEKRADDARLADQKARDQQTIAQQLATDKTEKTFAEALKQQGETFTAAIANIVNGLSEVKGGLSDIRSEQRGGRANMTAIIAAAGFVATVLGIITVLAANGMFGSGG